jgi:UDP-glucuronate 4-epimerase
MAKVLITGSAGFVGFHLSKRLLQNGHEVLGLDSITDYYDVNLKYNRLKILSEFKNFQFEKINIENIESLNSVSKDFMPSVIVHLAAQAGVRYSLENPRAYINTNIIGTYNILELARELDIKHLLMASTSSVYGANTQMPFNERQNISTPLTVYAATKSSTELIAHSVSHIYNIPVTMFRFFTVYGPWGRPDMALFKFTHGILNNKAIDIYNNGEMQRDFTYVEDLVRSIELLINQIPQTDMAVSINDNVSPVAPFRVVNIGNSDKINLMDFISEIEKNLGKKAIKNMMAMQTGDVPATWADVGLLKDLTGFSPNTTVSFGIEKFVKWYTSYYKDEM